MLRLLLRFLVVVVPAISAAVAQPAAPTMPQPIGYDPNFGAICAGPYGPGPCSDVQRFLLIQQVASSITLQQVGFDPVFGPICAGPLGPGPCREVQIFIATRQVGMQRWQPRDVHGAARSGPL